MEYVFGDKEMEKLYTTGRSRKYKLPVAVAKKFVMRVHQIEAATNIYDLWHSASLHFKKLKGHKNRWSVRIDKKWRLEFEMEWLDEEKTRARVYLVEITAHYGD